MAMIPIERVAAAGLVMDRANHALPPEAWTDGLNIRFRNGKVEKMDGWQEVMDPPSVSPAFVMNVDNDGDTFWIYASSVGAGSKVYAYNSGAHGDISKAGNYTVSNTYDWNGAVFQGIPILNNGQGTPQYWSALSLAQDLQDFPAWPASTTAKVIGVFKNFIIAMNITDPGGNHIHRVLWSDGAAPGSMPVSWDVTDPAFEAGQRDLSDVNSGGILDGKPLKDFFVVYKGESTWIMRYIGGNSIFATNQAMQVAGLLAHRCACPLTLPKNKQEVHFSHNGIEVGIFDGQGYESVIENRVRKALNNDIDPTYYRQSFVVDDPVNHEAIFAYPTNGATRANKALVWNYLDNLVTFRDFVGVHAANGTIEGDDTTTWDADTGTWDDSGIEPWQESQRRKVVIADQGATKLYRLGGLANRNGVSFDSFVKRRGLSVIGQDRQGEPVSDINTRKLINRIWFKLTGGPVNVRIGSEEMPGPNDDETNLTWEPYQVLDPTVCNYVDGMLNTRLLAIEIRSSADEIWSLEGYSPDVEPVSEN